MSLQVSFLTMTLFEQAVITKIIANPINIRIDHSLLRPQPITKDGDKIQSAPYEIPAF